MFSIKFHPSTKNKKIEELKILREKTNWEIEDERQKILPSLLGLIIGWSDQLPNLRDIFRPEEIEYFLSDCVSSINNFNAHEYVAFVVRIGYKDEPKVDKDGNLLLHRTTRLEERLVTGIP
ncbi:hypothetical protein TKK_0002594 [Trichogramma kaykai]